MNLKLSRQEFGITTDKGFKMNESLWDISKLQENRIYYTGEPLRTEEPLVTEAYPELITPFCKHNIKEGVYMDRNSSLILVYQNYIGSGIRKEWCYIVERHESPFTIIDNFESLFIIGRILGVLKEGRPCRLAKDLKKYEYLGEI